MKVSIETLRFLHSLGHRKAGECIAYYQSARALFPCNASFYWKMVDGEEQFYCYLIA